MKREIRVIISGGGTGGHIFPAISIADSLCRIAPECRILFVGALGRMEMERVPSAGYRIVGLPVAGLKRSLSPENLLLPYKLFKSVLIAGKILKEFDPHIAVGVGGYASGPLLWMAGKKGIPYIIQEQNSYAGITNRILGKKAAAVCVAYPGMERFFAKDKILLTGNPVREGIGKSSIQQREMAFAYFNLDVTKKTILITGGSLGAGTLNRCVQEWLEQNMNSSVNIIWQCGKFYYSSVNEFNQQNPRSFVHCYQFIDRMDLAYAAADVVITRAGAGTISELSLAGKAAIFVPSPNVAEDHQRHNAMSLVRQEAAIMVEDHEALKTLMPVALKLLQDERRIEQLEYKIGETAISNSSHKIAEETLKIAGYL